MKKTARNRTITRQLIDEAKDQACTDCRELYPPWVMDFDHVIGQKSYNIATMVGCAPARLKAEIAKCEVVCANCHRMRTYLRRNYVKDQKH